MMRLNVLGGCVAGLLLCVSSADAAVAPSSVAEAVKRADKAAIRAMLQKRADVNAPEPDGSTALHWAAYTDDTGNRRVADSRGRQRQDDESLRRDAARAGFHERQREDDRGLGEGRRRSQRRVAPKAKRPSCWRPVQASRPP